MKYLMLLLITISALSCGDDSESNQSNKVDISACFSPELGATESEQFYYDILKGEINNK